MMTTVDEEIRDLGRRWTEAEQNNDAAAIEPLLADDFRAVGPLGFVLNKGQWLERYRSGVFATETLALDELDVRAFGDTAIGVGRETQRGTYQGRRTDGQFRVTLIAVRAGAGWVLAGLHLSPIAPPPNAQNPS